MKILFVTESYWPNMDGGALFERRLVHGLIDQGHTLQVWTPGKKLLSYLEKDGTSVIIREKSFPLIFNLKYRLSYWPFFKIGRIIRNFQPDIIHIHNPGLMGLCTMLYARRHKLPTIATNHLMPENILLNIKWLGFAYKLIYKLIWRYLVWFHNQASFVTSPTNTAISLLKQHGLKTPCQAVSNGIDVETYNTSTSPDSISQSYHIPPRPILLYLGRVDGEKRIDIIIQALPLIVAKIDVQLVIAGYGNEMAKLVALAEELGMADHVTFTGRIPETDKPLLYKLATIFVISSPAELQSIVTLEAMASHKPVVAVNVAALSELVHDGVNGHLFKENDYRELATKCTDLLQNSQKLTDFGEASYQIVVKDHSNQSTISKYEQIYKRLAGQK